MTTSIFLGACLLALFTLPLLVLWRLSQTKQQKAARMRSYGWTWEQVGNALGVHRTTAAKWGKAATA